MIDGQPFTLSDVYISVFHNLVSGISDLIFHIWDLSLGSARNLRTSISILITYIFLEIQLPKIYFSNPFKSFTSPGERKQRLSGIGGSCLWRFLKPKAQICFTEKFYLNEFRILVHSVHPRSISLLQIKGKPRNTQGNLFAKLILFPSATRLKFSPLRM